MIIQRKCRPLLALAAGVSTAATSHVQAFQAADLLAFEIGPVTLRPHAALTQSYNDNLFYQSSGPNLIGDFITTTSIGLTASIGREETVNPWLEFFEAESNFVSLDYELDYLYYLRRDDLNADNHTFTFKNRWKGNRLTFKGTDNVQVMTSVVGGRYGISQNVSRQIYADNYSVDYSLTPKTRLYVTGSHSTTDYETGTPLYDVNSLRGTAGFGFKALPKTGFFGEVYYGQSAVGPNRPNYIKGPHLQFIGGFIGAQGSFTPHISGMVKVGYESREFSDGTTPPNAPVVQAGVTHRFRQKTATSLTYARRTAVSVQTAGVTYVADDFGLRVDQRIGSAGRLVASLGGYFEIGEYGETGYYAGRQDNWFRIRADLSYMIRVWMAANLGYEFEKLNSSGKGIIDYDVNRVTLGLVVGY